MKFILILSMLVPFLSWGKSAADFNKALLKDVQKEIKKDDESFKTRTSRGPASVESEEVRSKDIQEVPKIDKNVRQIGPNNW